MTEKGQLRQAEVQPLPAQAILRLTIQLEAALQLYLSARTTDRDSLYQAAQEQLTQLRSMLNTLRFDPSTNAALLWDT